MRPLLESDFAEFVWMPFVIGFLGLLLLRAAVLGNLRDLVDVTVLYFYFGVFSVRTFYNRLYQYGYNLDPEAAITVQPFTPPFFGRVQVANFHIGSFPGAGTYALVVLGLLLVAALAVSLRRTRQACPAG